MNLRFAPLHTGIHGAPLLFGEDEAPVEHSHDLDRRDHHDRDPGERDRELLTGIDEDEELPGEWNREHGDEQHEHRADDEHFETIERTGEHGEHPDADHSQDHRRAGAQLILMRPEPARDEGVPGQTERHDDPRGDGEAQ